MYDDVSLHLLEATNEDLNTGIVLFIVYSRYSDRLCPSSGDEMSGSYHQGPVSIRAAYVGFLAGKMALRPIFLQALQIYSSSHHSNNAPYSPVVRVCRSRSIESLGLQTVLN
jgi:hypothetical protein